MFLDVSRKPIVVSELCVVVENWIHENVGVRDVRPSGGIAVIFWKGCNAGGRNIDGIGQRFLLRGRYYLIIACATGSERKSSVMYLRLSSVRLGQFLEQRLSRVETGLNLLGAIPKFEERRWGGCSVELVESCFLVNRAAVPSSILDNKKRPCHHGLLISNRVVQAVWLQKCKGWELKEIYRSLLNGWRPCFPQADKGIAALYRNDVAVGQNIKKGLKRARENLKIGQWRKLVYSSSRSALSIPWSRQTSPVLIEGTFPQYENIPVFENEGRNSWRESSRKSAIQWENDHEMLHAVITVWKNYCSSE